MWKFLLLIAAVIVWPGSAQDQQVYLTTIDNWSFWKIRATGPMTNANVKATCKAAGMKLPCYRRGRDKWGWWAPGCIKFHHAEYITLNALSGELCGRTSGYGSRCQPLDETFVYAAGRDSAFGVEYMSDNAVLGLKGANYNNMYALCAGEDVA
ncbi:uncharacterized protein LOC118427329 [Branchiostoma floridae]|uniref:Uncharacterized protein LOC118427329 n=1 Tax=Branchiostoma floridae TaxID=7739 RepID=A0A9J7M265_BRAFL|nr:uncharacterized protein LOC118427329 [Branchiostoma floridae]